MGTSVKRANPRTALDETTDLSLQASNGTPTGGIVRSQWREMSPTPARVDAFAQLRGAVKLAQPTLTAVNQPGGSMSFPQRGIMAVNRAASPIAAGLNRQPALSPSPRAAPVASPRLGAPRNASLFYRQ